MVPRPARARPRPRRCTPTRATSPTRRTTCRSPSRRRRSATRCARSTSTRRWPTSPRSTPTGAYLKAIETLWADIVGGKIYVTGGIGASGDNEAFGPPYDLPNLTAYAETCAGGRQHPVQPADVPAARRRPLHRRARAHALQRACSPGSACPATASSTTTRSPPAGATSAPAGSAARAARPTWRGCSRRCPATSTPSATATCTSTCSSAAARAPTVAGTPVTITQTGDYPWNGAIALTLDPVRDVEMTVRVRVPGWAQGRPIPSDLYTFAEAGGEAPRLAVNGAAVPLVVENGYATVKRTWRKGDRIALELPMPLLTVVARPEVRADAGRFAFQRGPLVFAAEGPDNGGRTANLVLDRGAAYEAAFKKDLLGGVETVSGKARAVIRDDVLGLRTVDGTVVAIPYYAWAHRGPSEMTVWFPTDAAQVPPPEMTTEPFGAHAGRQARLSLHHRQPQQRARADHQLRRQGGLARGAGSGRHVRRRRPRLRHARRVGEGQPVLRRADRPLRQPHRRRRVHARRQGVRAGEEQRPERAARRPQGLRQGGLGRRRGRHRRRPRRRADLRQQGRRGGLPRHAARRWSPTR